MNRDVPWANQIDQLIVIQNGRCGACGLARNWVTLCLDHDHATGLTRGLLCRACNFAEGRGDNDPQIVAYLADPPAKDYDWEYQNQEGIWARDLMAHEDRQMAKSAVALAARHAAAAQAIADRKAEVGALTFADLVDLAFPAAAQEPS